MATVQCLDFSYLDQQDFSAKYATGSDLNQIRFYIGGIKCSKCVRKLEDLPLRIAGLKFVQVEMGRNLAHVEIDKAQTSFAKVADEIAKLGFQPVPLLQEEDFRAQEKREDRAELIRLAVAAACAGNIMTFAFATYLGAPETWSQIFAWLSFAIYIPVVTYVAQPFYRGSWQALRQRQLSIDLPMAVASFSGFLFSTIELLRGKSDIYFDSLSGFLFLILISRFVQKRLQRSFLRPSDISERAELQRVRRIESHGWAWRPLEMMKSGDRFLLQAPETLPADAELQNAKAHFSLAWLSGESKPKAFLRGSVVPAGARLISGEAHMIFQRALNETTFGRILQEVQRFSLSKNRIVSQADRWAQVLLVSVFTIAIAFLLFYWRVSPEDAIQRALALIILACPCAMAFGTPLALASALKNARKKGLIVRDANVFEKMQNVHTILFDKTGTLTDTELSLKNPNSVPPVYQKIILSLENESLHPIAFAFRQAFNNPEYLPPSEGRKEVEGVGVSGYLYGRHYEIKKSEASSTRVSCALYEDEKQILTFEFDTRVKPDGLTVLENLRRRGLELRLVTGDKFEAAHDLAKQMNFQSQEVFSGLSPQEKALLVEKTPGVLMIGDGINDSLALMKADVAVAVAGGVEAALRSSHIYMSEPGIKGLLSLFQIADRAMRGIRQNLIISVVYNVIAGVLALLGFINPFVAALLMPVSSGFILISTWIRSHK